MKRALRFIGFSDGLSGFTFSSTPASASAGSASFVTTSSSAVVLLSAPWSGVDEVERTGLKVWNAGTRAAGESALQEGLRVQLIRETEPSKEVDIHIRGAVICE